MRAVEANYVRPGGFVATLILRGEPPPVRLRSMKRFGLIFLLCFAAPGRGEDVWLQPERFSAMPGKAIWLSLTTAESFNGFERAIGLERVRRARARVADEPVSVIDPVAGPKALALSMVPPRPGVAVVAIELLPRMREIADVKIERTLRALHASDALRAMWDEVPAPRRWREVCVETATTFVRIGEPVTDDKSWSAPLGLPLEIVPQRNPTTLRVGDELRVCVMRAGEPYAGCVLTFVSEGEAHEHVVVTDGSGFATAPLDLAGLWLVRGAELSRSASPDRIWDSHFTTMLVQVN